MSKSLTLCVRFFHLRQKLYVFVVDVYFIYLQYFFDFSLFTIEVEYISTTSINILVF